MNYKKPIMTIGITSYKRLEELKRCINSIHTSYIDDIEILISEDHSPLSDDIRKMVNDIKKVSQYNILFTTNEKNLGYDQNLGSIIKKSSGKFIFFLSDDDTIMDKSLDDIIDFLRLNSDYGVYYSSFYTVCTKKLSRYWNNNRIIEKGDKSVAKYIYDSILFSGLIFRKEYVKKYDSSKFKNFNYFQVYLFMKMIKHYGGYYFKKPSVICIGDGENAYGIAESSGGNALLADRKSVKSNLEFHKTLIKIVKIFDEEENTNIFDKFSKQYSLHAYTGLYLARKEGKKYFEEYWETLNHLDIRLTFIVRVYYLMLSVLGYRSTDMILYIFKKAFKREKY